MTNARTDIEALRVIATRVGAALMALHVPIVLGACVALGRDWIGLTVGALGCALVPLGLRRQPGAVRRILSSVSLMVSVSILVAAFDGVKVQVDLHMYYFAALAILVATCDWRAIAAAAAAVAVHHLLLNFLLPDLIYPGGSDLGRFLLHAVILVVEAAALAWIAYSLERIFRALEDGARAAETSKIEKTAMAANAEEERMLSARTAIEAEREQVVRSFGDALAALSNSDLRHVMSADVPPEYAQLRYDYQDAVAKLRQTVKAIAGSAEEIRGGVQDMAAASDDLSSRTARQAASFATTAATLDQITGAVAKTAEGAANAREGVAAVRSDAERSGGVVNQAILAMGAIQQSAREIGQIIGVIDEIAFQPNLLALNAGVEAARAGDAGRGFAVVASEVRALAQRSAAAAKEIKVLITTSSSHVATGVGLVGETGSALDRIASQIAAINTAVADIAATAKEQATGLVQVSAAVMQMDQATQQNVSMVEVSTAGSHALAHQADRLTILMDGFHLGGHEPQNSPASTLRRAA